MVIKKQKSGVILTEALFAVSLLVIGGIILGSIINNALSITGISKNYLIGQNLATEGVEAVKNIRDTNWMIFPIAPDISGSPKKAVWLCMEPSSTCEGSNSEIPITGNSYLLRQDSNDRWKLINSKDVASELDLYSENNINKKPYILKVVERNFGTSNSYLKFTSGGNEVTVPSYPIFHRGVKFISVSDTEAEFEVKVQWMEGTQVRTISRVVKIYNYQYAD